MPTAITPSFAMTDEMSFFARAEALITRLEGMLSPASEEPDWDIGVAFQWQRKGERGAILPIRHLSSITLDDLQCLERQKTEVTTNTLQFVNGLPANNVLLWGPRGTGKSSLIKAILNAYASKDLRMIEVERKHLADLPAIVDLVYKRPERFIVFCDDLSFESNDTSYKPLKVILDGSLSNTPDNLLIYATSNRRHLLPERQSDNDDTRISELEIHYGESVEERISLSERFGLWVAFHPFTQEDYLEIAFYWINKLDVIEDNRDVLRAAALRWALLHGSRSGRSAWQFARDWVGKKGLGL